MNKNYKEKIEEYRLSIDRLDSVLIYTLGERFEKTKKIGKFKVLDLMRGDNLEEIQNE